MRLVVRNLFSILLVPALICALAGEGRSEALDESEWYGGQILVADGVSLLTLITGGAYSSRPVFFVGAASYVITPAVIHVVHDHKGRAALSALMRILPVGGGLLTYVLLESRSDKPDSEYNRMGWSVMSLFVVGLGMGTATAVDAYFAREAPDLFAELPPAPRKPVSFAAAGIVPTPNGASLMIGGRF